MVNSPFWLKRRIGRDCFIGCETAKAKKIMNNSTSKSKKLIMRYWVEGFSLRRGCSSSWIFISVMTSILYRIYNNEIFKILLEFHKWRVSYFSMSTGLARCFSQKINLMARNKAIFIVGTTGGRWLSQVIVRRWENKAIDPTSTSV